MIKLFISILISSTVLFAQIPSELPDSLLSKDLIFVYVHGFAEYRKIEPFKKKMQEFLSEHPTLNYDVFTYRWEKERIDFLNPIDQWENSKKVADSATTHFNTNIISKLEDKKIPYVVVGYSLGTQLVTKALERYGHKKLKYLKDIYFLASAMDKDVQPDLRCLPEGMKIISYYSKYFDEVLKISYRFQEDVPAGGEVGFDDTSTFVNYRTACTHVNKGGPIQRDYSNMASAIAMLTLFKENIFVEGEPLNYNLDMLVMDGEIQWNDIIEFDSKPKILIQQNVHTYHYRAVEISDSGFRTRKAWGMNLHMVLKEMGLFNEPYVKVIKK
ncbi:MAG: hypothetical protein PF574_10665 [Candidatus Delongbacteria bacterium]|jgi:hypothetical protein|nr:hypothetical protein [Candidatus Delongbacteria bacterium]